MPKNQNGSTLILVLFILVIISILSLSLLNINLTHLDILKKQKYYEAAYYYAEAGLINQIDTFIDDIEELYNIPVINIDNYEEQLGETNIIKTEFDDYYGEKVNITTQITYKECKNDQFILYISSKCNLGEIERNLIATIQFPWKDPKHENFYFNSDDFIIKEWKEKLHEKQK